MGKLCEPEYTKDFADIEVDDSLVIQLGDDGTPESVTIQSGRMGGTGDHGHMITLTEGNLERILAE